MPPDFLDVSTPAALGNNPARFVSWLPLSDCFAVKMDSRIGLVGLTPAALRYFSRVQKSVLELSTPSQPGMLWAIPFVL